MKPVHAQKPVPVMPARLVLIALVQLSSLVLSLGTLFAAKLSAFPDQLARPPEQQTGPE
jgi:hypothetical protein